MTIMVKTMAIAAVILFSNTMALAGPIPGPLQSSLDQFALLDSTLKDGVLRVVLNRSVVNQETYKTVITMGACATLWMDKAGWGKAKIERIEVMNRVQGQGFAFVGGRKACADLGHAKGEEASRRYLAAHTWVCVAGFPCRERRPGEKTSGDE